MKQLILAEKPSVARDLAGVLGQFESKDGSKNGYLENDKYIVTWAIGHLVELAIPEDYDPELKKWTLEKLPILPESFKLKVNPQTAKQFKVVKQLVNRSDVQELICATDAGREGELIFRYIYRLSGCRKPFKRLWLSETTPVAVRQGFENLCPGADFDNLAAAAEARSQADWLIGINASRAFTVRHNNLLSVGRVQTPTLALIVNREAEIKNFISAPYWELHAEFMTETGESYPGKWFNGDQTRFLTQADAGSVENKIKNKLAGVIQVDEKEIRELPPLLFNLNDLQKEANKKFGMPAARTLEVAQALYESKKLLTYPRTDSRHITQALAATIPDRLDALECVESYEPYVKVAQQARSLGKRYVDDSKVTDHTALIPTNTKPGSNLNHDEQKIYDLVARRFLATFFPCAEYMQTKVVTETAGESFITSGRVELAQGWKMVYAETENEDKGGEENADGGNIPKLSQGEKVKTGKTSISQKKTQPPKRHTEASLLTVMEGAGKMLEDKELKDAMKGHGLGTPATRASVIERLIKVGYIERNKKALIPTTKGETLIDLVPEVIKSPEMTGRWEKILADIEAGNANPEKFMAGIIDLTRQTVELARSQESAGQAQSDRESLGKCPFCGKSVLESPKSYSCSGYREGCKFTIWKEIASKKITATQAKALLEKGKTGTIKGFTSKADKKFDAVLQIKDGKVVFQFENNNGSDRNKQSLGKCPLCSKDITESGKGYGCTGYRDGCKFVVWKEIAGKKISAAQAKELLQKGKTAVIKGFKSKNGKEFAAALVMRQEGKVGFEFVRG